MVSADGKNDVATTVANEKDGWLYLSANNFEFSSPTIQVKLSQDKLTPSPTTVRSPKLTILCVKGKVTKTVSGLNPKCPTGYKLKSR
mgnify:FL=1